MAKIYHKGSNLFDYDDLTQDYTINSSGNAVAQEGRFATTTPIDVDGIEIVELTFTGSDSVRVIFATKNNGTLIDRQTGLRNGDAIDVSGADELYLAFYLSGGAPLEIADVDNISVNSTWENYTPKIMTSGEWTNNADKEYTNGSWGSGQRALAIQREANLKKILTQELDSIEKD